MGKTNKSRGCGLLSQTCPCGVTFFRQRQNEDAKYCSIACKGAAQVNREEFPMTDGTIIKVTRNIIAYKARATVETQYGTPSKQFLSEDDRYLMGGDSTGYFYAESQSGKWTLKRRAPKQTW